MPKRWIVVFMSITLLTALIGIPPALAEEGKAPATPPAQVPADPPGLTLYTRYPAQEAAIGETVTFGLTLRDGTAPEIVRLNFQDLPEGWTASFRGGGRVVEAAYVEPANDATVDLKVEPPKDVKAGSYKFMVIAQDDAKEQVKLPIELTIKDKLPPTMGFDIELPTLIGTPDTTFRYNATLKNEGDADLSVNLLADAPKEFQVSFKLNSQDVTSIPLAANETKHLSIEAKAFSDIEAGDYPIKVTVQGGETQAEASLTAKVTGQSELSVSAPDGRLSAQAYVGGITPIKLVVQNTGSAPARTIALSASQPAGWKVDFDPKQIDEIPSGQQVEVTANIQPTDQAVAGDYVVTMKAQPQDGAAKSADFRITVLTSTLWGIVGVGLIAVAVAVVGVAVSRFGRR